MIATAEKTVPVFTRENVENTSLAPHGDFKRVVLGDLISDGGKPCAIKFPRLQTESDGQERLAREFHGEVEGSAAMRLVDPTRVPGFLGEYDGVRSGYVFDQIVGVSLRAAVESGQVADADVHEFGYFLDALVAEGIYPPADTLNVRNLMYGHLPGFESEGDRIIMTETHHETVESFASRRGREPNEYAQSYLEWVVDYGKDYLRRRIREL